MIKHSTREAAKKLGINYDTLAHYVAVGKVPAPEIISVGRRMVHMWTGAEIEHVRQLLPKIANGRKKRYKKHSEPSTQHSAKANKKHSAVSTQQSVKAKGKTKSKTKGRSKKKKT